MVWKVLSRTLHSVFVIGGLVMQAFGLYFDITEAATVPQGPFGLSMFAWGVILFTLASISVISQLWWHIKRTEDSYAYALSFDGLSPTSVGEMLEIMLNLTNTMEKPMEFAIEDFHLEIGGKCASSSGLKNRGQVIPRGKTAQYVLPAVEYPGTVPCKGTLGYKLVYGRPGNLVFRQSKEMELTYRITGEGKGLMWQFTQQEDTRIKKRESRWEDSPSQSVSEKCPETDMSSRDC